MLVKTILNKIVKFKCFVFHRCIWDIVNGLESLIVEIHARKNSKAVCSGCNSIQPGYDTLKPRLFQFPPLWGIPFFFQYAMRRVQCCHCGIIVETVPWADGKNHLTHSYIWFLARWGKRLSWLEVSRIFRTSWDTVFRAIEAAVEWGLAHRNLDGITAIGVDEISIRRGHKYLTLVYEIGGNSKRLLWVNADRTKKSFVKFFDFLGEERSKLLKIICSDMWKNYLDVIADKAKLAVNVLDRFHIVKMLNKKIDQVRATEAKEYKKQGKAPVLIRSRWCFLKRAENLTEKQYTKLSELVKYNLKTMRAYLLKEKFNFFWNYKSPAWAKKFFKKWCTQVMRSKIKPMKDFVKTMRNHEDLIFNWFKARKSGISLGAVEGLNNKARVTTKKAYGYRTTKVAKIALYHALGKLPEPESTHRFC
jgi:transposase